MRKKSVISFLGAAAVLAFAATPSAAAIIAENVSFSISGLQSINSDPATPDPVTGSFNITLDTSTDHSSETSGISLTSLNIALGSQISFDYNMAQDLLFVGGIAQAPACTDGPDCIQILPADNDFFLQIKNFSTSPTISGFGFGQTASPNDFWFIDTTKGSVASVTLGPIVTPGGGGGVPEPATWIAMLAGLFMVGLSVSSRRTVLSSV